MFHSFLQQCTLQGSSTLSIASHGSVITKRNEIFIFGRNQNIFASNNGVGVVVGQYQQSNTTFENCNSSFEEELDIYIHNMDCFYDEQRDTIYIACTCESYDEEEGFSIYFFEYSISKSKWRKLTVFPKRSGAVIEYRNHSFIIFGGIGTTRRFNDLHQYDIETNTWNHLPPLWDDIFNDASDSTSSIPNSPSAPNVNTISIPTPRHSSCHSLLRDSKELFIFGGNGKDTYLSYWNDNKFLDDAFIYHFGTQKWRSLNPAGNFRPSPRVQASCLYIDSWDCILLIGGTNTAQVFDEIFLFSISQNVWTKMQNRYNCGSINRLPSICTHTSHKVRNQHPLEIVTIAVDENNNQESNQIIVMQLWNESSVAIQAKLLNLLKNFPDVHFYYS